VGYRQLVGFLQIGVLAKRQAGADFLRKSAISLTELVEVRSATASTAAARPGVSASADVKLEPPRRPPNSTSGIVNDLARRMSGTLNFATVLTQIVGDEFESFVMGINGAGAGYLVVVASISVKRRISSG